MKKLTALLTAVMMLAAMCGCVALAEGSVPEDMVGKWAGVGTPVNGGTSIDLAFDFNADGTGFYTFDQGGYHEETGFTVTFDGSAFTLVPDGMEDIAHADGTWKFDGAVLTLDITSTLPNGATYSYTAECERVDEAAGAIAAVPEELVGAWAGTAMLEGSDHTYDLTAEFAADGTGAYTLDFGSYHEENTFAIAFDGNAFSIDVGDFTAEGTWTLEGGVLSVAFTSVFANGDSYSYTAECTRVSAEAGEEGATGVKWTLDTIWFRTLSEDSPFVIDAGMTFTGPTEFGSEFFIGDSGEIETDINMNGLIEAVPQLPFSVEELDLTQYTGCAVEGNTAVMTPGDVKFDIAFTDVGMSLAYTASVEIASTETDGLVSEAGSCDILITLGFVAE